MGARRFLAVLAAITVTLSVSGPDAGWSATVPRRRSAAIDARAATAATRHRFVGLGSRLEAVDDLYRIAARPRGLEMFLRQAGPMTPPPGRTFDEQPVYRLETASVTRGRRTDQIPLLAWRADGNRAQRTVAPGLVEQVTSGDGSVEWDFVLERATDGPVSIRADVTAGGSPERADRSWRWPAGDGRFVRTGELVVMDAASREIYRALPRADASSMTLEVPSRVLRSAAYPVTIDPAVTPEYSTGGAFSEAAPGSQGIGTASSSCCGFARSSAVAWNGSNFFVVWSDNRSGSSDIYGAEVRPSGQVIDGSGIAISTAPNVQTYPSVAWNGTVFLVVWTDSRHDPLSTDIYGARVSPAGEVLDPSGLPINLSAGTQWDVTVASDGDDFLVVWDDRRGARAEPWSARVTGEGIGLDGAGVQIFGSSGGYVNTSPVVAWSGSNYVVAWWFEPVGETQRIMARGVGSNGQPLGVANVVHQPGVGGRLGEPSIASSGTGTLMVTWMDYTLTSAYASRVNSTGTSLDASGIAVSSGSARAAPSVAFDGTNYFVTWTDSRNGNHDIYGAHVSLAGAVLEPSGLAFVTEIGTQTGSAVAWGSSTYLVVWTDSRSGGADVYGSRIPPNGAALDGSGLLISKVTGMRLSPSVATDGAGTYLVVWTELRPGGTSDIYGARVDDLGNVLDPSGIAISTAPNDQFDPAVAWNGSSFFVVWNDYRAGAAGDVYGARVSASGTVLDPGGVAVSTASGDQFGPTVASNGSGLLVVWSDGRSGAIHIHGARVSSTGVLLDGAGFLVSSAGADLRAPAAAWAAPVYLVVWQDSSELASLHVYGARVSAAGALIDPAGIAIATGGGSQRLPAVASNGTSFLVSWDDCPTNCVGRDVFAARVNVDGVVVDATALGVATTGDDQRVPAVGLHGEDFLVVWEQPGGLYGTRVGDDGVIVDPGGIAVATAGTDVTTPSLAGGPGGRTAVAYERPAPEYGAAYHVFVRFLDDALNDRFADAQVIEGRAGAVTGRNLAATKEPGEPDHAGRAGGGSVWYSYTAPAAGELTVDTAGSDFDTLVGVYTGPAVDGLTEVASNDDAPGLLTSEQTFSVVPDTDYLIAVDGKNGASGNIALQWSLFDEIAPDTSITSGPSGFVTSPDATFAFTSDEAGSVFECALDTEPFAPCVSPRVYSDLSQAAHTFKVRAIDPVANVDLSPATRDFQVDTSAPQTTIDVSPDDPTSDGSPTFEFSADEAADFECAFDNAPFEACTSPWTKNRSEGERRFRVRATDRAGNVDPVPATYVWVIDQTPPTAEIKRPQTGLYVLDEEIVASPEEVPDVGAIVVVGELTIDAEVEDTLSGLASVRFEVTPAGPVPLEEPQVQDATYDSEREVWTVRYQPHAPGRVTIVVRATDKVGLVRTDSVSVVVLAV